MDIGAYKELVFYQNSQSQFAKKTGGNGVNKYGYYSFKINGEKIPGQRLVSKRVDAFKEVYDFHDKTVVNIGANAGVIDYSCQK